MRAEASVFGHPYRSVSATCGSAIARPRQALAMAPRSPPRAPPRGFKLFGVQLSDSPPPSMRKSFSLDHLPCLDPAPSSLPLDGYASDGLVHTNSSNCERKKGVPWTEEEHRLFLLGLQKLGKGDWRGISRSFVKTRTPTQVASHAQKYFLRRNNLNKRRRRSSLFDITPDTVSSLPEESLLEESGCERAIGSHGTHELNFVHRGRGEESVHVYPIGGFPLPLSLYPLPCMPAHVPKIRDEPIEAVETEDLEDCQMSMVAGDNFSGPSGSISVIDTAPESQGEVNQSNLPSLFPMYSVEKEGSWSSECKIVKPSPISTPPMSVDDSMRLSELSFGTTRPVMEPTPLSYKLSADRPRHSAFHPMSSVRGSESNAISVP